MRVLIISPHFPPSSLAGVHRARHLAKHLPLHGWTPVVIRVNESYYAEAPDAALAALVPESVVQVRTSAVPTAIARAVGIGDIGLRGYFQMRQAIARQIAAARPDAVLITGSPFYPMLLAGWIKQHFGVPVVLDFQDPWVSTSRSSTSPFSKAGLAHRLALLMEPRAVRHAAFITSVSETQNAQMAQRYSWLDAERMAAIPIGGDPEDFDALRAAPLTKPQVALLPKQVNLSYVGTFLPRAGALVTTLFKGLSALRRNSPQVASRLRLHFVGTSNQPGAFDTYRVRALAAAEGVSDLVSETPQRIPFLEALNVTANSDASLLIGSDEPHYTASKIYPALMSGRPYISLFHEASSAHAILSQAGGGRSLSFSSVADLEQLAVPLESALFAAATDLPSFGTADPDAYADYTASNVAARFAHVLERVIK